MRLVCSVCEKEIEADPRVYNKRALVGMHALCPHCTGKLDAVKVRGKTDDQKRSQLQEKRAAKRHGGRVQPASGAGQAKGDFRVQGSVRGECKFTRAASYRLKLDDLNKINSECSMGEYPVLELEFQGCHPPARFAVIPGWLYDHFRTLDEDNKDDS